MSFQPDRKNKSMLDLVCNFATSQCRVQTASARQQFFGWQLAKTGHSQNFYNTFPINNNICLAFLHFLYYPMRKYLYSIVREKSTLDGCRIVFHKSPVNRNTFLGNRNILKSKDVLKKHLKNISKSTVGFQFFLAALRHIRFKKFPARPAVYWVQKTPSALRRIRLKT